MSAVRTTSYRLDADVKERLQRQAAVEGISERALLERLVREGLDAVHYPGIVYHDGPTGGVPVWPWGRSPKLRKACFPSDPRAAVPHPHARHRTVLASS